MGIPKTSTLLRAVENNNLTTWPALTTRNITKYLPRSVETALGHLYQERETQRSTKSVIQKREKAQFVKIITSQEEGEIYTDQTWRFPNTPSRRYTYILILYDQDRNSILSEPIKSKSQDEQLREIRL